MTKLVLATSGMVGLAYVTEIFTALYSGDHYEHYALMNRLQGPLAWGYWLMVACNVVVPQLFWLRRIRSCLPLVFVISILVNVGMWFERFIIIVTGLERDFLPSSWANYAPTIIEVATLAGSFGLFFTCFLLFCRVLPAIAIAEVKGLVENVERGAWSVERGSKACSPRFPAHGPRPHGPRFAASSKGKKTCCAAVGRGQKGWLAGCGHLHALRLARNRQGPGAGTVAVAAGSFRVWPGGRGSGTVVPVLGVGPGLAHKYRGPAVELAAGVCAHHFRTDGALCRLRSGLYRSSS